MEKNKNLEYRRFDMVTCDFYYGQQQTIRSEFPTTRRVMMKAMIVICEIKKQCKN